MWADGQSRSPVAVVAKMHYFARLDVTRTVKNFATECPRFWSSAEFMDTLHGSSILALDSAFFAEVPCLAQPSRGRQALRATVSTGLLPTPHSKGENLKTGLESSHTVTEELSRVYCNAMQALYGILEDDLRGSSELLALVVDYVRAASWQELMQPLLPLLPEEAVLRCCTHSLPVMAFGEARPSL